MVLYNLLFDLLKENMTTSRLVAFVLSAMIVSSLFTYLSEPDNIKQLSFTGLKAELEGNNVDTIDIYDNGEIEGSLKSSKERFSAKISPNMISPLTAQSEEKNKLTRIAFKSVRNNSFWMSTIVLLIPLFIMLWIFMSFFNRMGSQGNKFIASKAKVYTESNVKVTFNDVAGIDEAIDEVKEIVEFLKNPYKFASVGATIPRGVLLVGPPGTGKTLLARAVAGEAKVPYHYISGSDFIEMFVGVGAGRVRNLFAAAKKKLPSIIFIDELDAVGRHRGAGLGGGHDEREQTLNQLLVEMQGFEPNAGLIVMAATNRPDILDPALLRPGRFDRTVIVGRPDIRGRLSILKIHTKKLVIDDKVSLETIARGTSGFTGADLAKLANEAALSTGRKNRKVTTAEDFEEARDRVIMGPERKSLVLSEAEKTITAYHEAGHAIVALMVPEADPVHKVSIIPRGMALGITSQLPQEDKHSYSKEYLLSQLAILMGGRSAEELIDKTGGKGVTTGASNDIERATEIATKMVCTWGMSELGLRKFGSVKDNPFLGKQMTESPKDYSEQTAKRIDDEIQKLLADAHRTAYRILNEKRNFLDRVADALLKEETITGERVMQILNEVKQNA